LKASVAVVGASILLVAVSILAVPAVASGADYIARTSTTAESAASDTAVGSSETIPAVSAPDSPDLVPLISAWGASGLVLFGGGAVAVAASVRKQRKTAV
jgi:hypothetical protein